MCSNEAQLCQFLTEEFFGSIVANVVNYMCNNGYQPLRYISQETKLKNDQVKKALCVLLQHKLASYQIYKQHIQYKANVENILHILLYPKIIYTSKVLYGDIAELIVEEILHHGIQLMKFSRLYYILGQTRELHQMLYMALMSDTVKRVAKRLQNQDKDSNLKEKVEDVFKGLVQTHFLLREGKVVDSNENEDKKSEVAPTFNIEEHELYEIPSLTHDSRTKQRRISDDDGEPEAKRPKTSDSQVKNETTPDDGIYWAINFTRYEQFFRDQAIVASMTKKHGVECGEIIRAMLRISEVTTSAEAAQTQAISAAEIARSLVSGCSITMQNINQHLRLLSSSSEKVVELADDTGAGGSYSVNLKNAVLVLATAHVVSYVEERFGSKSCRIFRLLMLKQHLEQKQVEEFAMIPAKEAKEYLYCMLGENFLTMQEIPRTADHAPSRTFYLYAVNMTKISRMLLVKCCKSISNLIVRQKHTKSSYKRLLDKRQQIDAMKESLQADDEEQLKDIEDMLSSAERGQLTKYEHCTNKLRNSQLQIVDSVLMLKSYLKSVFT